MQKDKLTKDFEDMLKTYPFIRFNDFTSRRPNERVFRDGDNLFFTVFPQDSDEEILNNIMKCIEVAGEMQIEKAEYDAYKRQNPKLIERYDPSSRSWQSILNGLS